MYPLISRSLGLVSFISIAVVSMWVLEKSFVFADSALVSEAKQNDPEANLKYLFAVFFLVWALFFGYIFFLSRRLKEMGNEVAMLRKIISEKE
ncbi:MAG TPA: CcmD family protein [Dehalococcoidia bacterium]|nr:CcmD family protein [Dehalococcoidia bacterium]